MEKVKCRRVIGDCEVAEDRPKEGRNPRWFRREEKGGWQGEKILMKEFGTVCVTTANRENDQKKNIVNIVSSTCKNSLVQKRERNIYSAGDKEIREECAAFYCSPCLLNVDVSI